MLGTGQRCCCACSLLLWQACSPPWPTSSPLAHCPPLYPQIVLRTINSSLSAYLSVTYSAGFFDAYDVLDCNVVQAGLLMKVPTGGGWDEVVGWCTLAGGRGRRWQIKSWKNGGLPVPGRAPTPSSGPTPVPGCSTCCRYFAPSV